MVIVDTSALLAFFNQADREHRAVAEVIAATPGPFVISPLVLAEFDYLVTTRHGVVAERAALKALADGSWQLPNFGLDLLARANDYLDQYADHAIGLADASIMVLASKLGTRNILTLDRRHFAFLNLTNGTSPQILPD